MKIVLASNDPDKLAELRAMRARPDMTFIDTIQPRTRKLFHVGKSFPEVDSGRPAGCR